MARLYSLVRYVEDVGRHEPVNVGALLWVDGRTLRKFVEREAINDHEKVRRFDELLGYLVENNDRGETEPGGDEDEPLLYSLARRRFPHFEITEPRPVDAAGDPEPLLDSLVSELVEDPARTRLAFWR
jgi:hypothetical protein